MKVEPGLNIRNIRLEKIRIGAQVAVSKLMMDAHAEWSEETLIEALVLRVRGTVFGRDHWQQEFSAPMDWWEAVKGRWGPAWLLRRWPVKYRRVVIHVKEFYPTLRHEVPGHDAILAVMEPMLVEPLEE